jgi:hypothetical protein
MTTCYKYETPVILAKKGEKEKLNEFMEKMYANDPSVIPDRIKEITGEEATESTDDDKIEEKEEKQIGITYSQALCDPEYRFATWVGFFIAIG